MRSLAASNARTSFSAAQRAARPAPRRSARVMASDAFEVAVKGDPASNTLLDCPFCQRVLLTMEVKKVPYSKVYIDFDNKPEWLLERSGGKVPLLHRGDFWLPDSDAIVAWLEAHYPSPSMASAVPADVTGGFFGAFRALLMAPAGSPDEASAKQAFIGELSKLEAWLAAPGHGPLFGGQQLDATDAALAPKMYHALTALRHFKGMELDAARFPAVAAYRDALAAAPEWAATDYGPEAIIKGWAKHLGK